MLGIYCRTSKSRPEKYTIENQREAGIECANKLGIKFQVYIDDGISGTLDDLVRDGLSDLFRDIRRGNITHVYCIDQSRIERDTRTWDFFVAECLNNNVGYYPGGSYFDLDNSTNRMFAKLMSVVNSYYAEITSKKVRLANARKARDGKTHGLKPYGYRRDDNNYYQIDEDEAKNVRRMFQLSLEGKGAYTIANIFNEENIPTKFSKNFKGNMKRKDAYTKNVKFFEKSDVKWRGNVISDMLNNKIYKGIREWNRHEDKLDYIDGNPVKRKVKAELVVADVPIIIEPALWDKVQTNLEKNRKNVGRKDEYHYLLNGLLYCDKCGGDYRGRKRLKGNDNAYKCAGKRYPNSKCDSRGIGIPRLESFIIKYLFIYRDFKKHFDDLKTNIERSQLLEEKLTKERTKLISIEKKLRNGYDLLLDTDIPNNEEIKSRIAKLESQKRELANTIQILEQRIYESDSKNMEKKIAGVVGSFEINKTPGILNADFDKIKKAIHEIINKIKISHQKHDKGGTFTIKVQFKGSNIYSIIETDWKLSAFKLVEYHIADDNSMMEMLKSGTPVYRKTQGIKENAKVESTSTISTNIKKHVHLPAIIKIADSELYYFD